MRKHPPRMKFGHCEQLWGRAGSSHALLRPVLPEGAPRVTLSPCPALRSLSHSLELTPSHFIVTQLCPTSLLTARLEQRSGRAGSESPTAASGVAPEHSWGGRGDRFCSWKCECHTGTRPCTDSRQAPPEPRCFLLLLWG